MRKPGKLTVIIGPMFAGKTKRLIKEVQKESKGRKVILFKSAMDNRYSAAEVVSHDGLRMHAEILGNGDACISSLEAAAREYEVIAIDEGQFWQGTKGFADALDRIASNSRSVYVALLNKDIYGNPFEVSKDLVAIADRIHFIESRCSKCGGKASFTQRVINGTETFGDLFVVAGSDLYEARCRRHFVRPGPKLL
ncbi:MAG: thymidine kinase [Candidatus Micrarchaeaceae archaeon]